MTIPKTVLQELLSYYSRTTENPDGINMDDPFELPAAHPGNSRRQGDRDDRAMRRASGARRS